MIATPQARHRGAKVSMQVLSPLAAFQAICIAACVGLVADARKETSIWRFGLWLLACLLVLLALFAAKIGEKWPSARAAMESLGANSVTWFVMVVALYFILRPFWKGKDSLIFLTGTENGLRNSLKTEDAFNISESDIIGQLSGRISAIENNQNAVSAKQIERMHVISDHIIKGIKWKLICEVEEKLNDGLNAIPINIEKFSDPMRQSISGKMPMLRERGRAQLIDSYYPLLGINKNLAIDAMRNAESEARSNNANLLINQDEEFDSPRSKLEYYVARAPYLALLRLIQETKRNQETSDHGLLHYLNQIGT